MNELMKKLYVQAGMTSPVVPSAISERRVSNTELSQRIEKSFCSAMQRRWDLPPSARSLTSEEITFLRSYTTASIGIGREEQNPLISFALEVVQLAATQIVCSGVREAIKGDSSQETTSYKATEEEEQIAGEECLKGSKKISSQGVDLKFAKKEEPGDFSKEARVHKEDSSLATMGEIANDNIEQKVKSFAANAVKSKLVRVSQEVSEARLLASLTKGDSLEKAVDESSKVLDAQRTFVKHSSSTIKAAAAVGSFLSKVEESGWENATVEIVKSTVLEVISKCSAEVVTTLVGCTNPVWCAEIVTTVLLDTFVASETAPPEMDMARPIRSPSLDDIKRSRLPDLYLVVPALRTPN